MWILNNYNFVELFEKINETEFYLDIYRKGCLCGEETFSKMKLLLSNKLDNINSSFLKEKIHLKEFLKSLYENIDVWIILCICIIIISYPNTLNATITFIIMTLLSYFAHYYTHSYRNIFTIVHHYHHENNDYISYFSEIILELTNSSIFFLISHYLFYNVYLFDIWTICFFTIFYISIHNINYGLLKVNNIHFYHHQNMYSNIGPDICDSLFGTKNEETKEPERILHVIPNILIISSIIYVLKDICKNYENIKQKLCDFCHVLTFLFLTILIILSYYLQGIATKAL